MSDPVELLATLLWDTLAELVIEVLLKWMGTSCLHAMRRRRTPSADVRPPA